MPMFNNTSLFKAAQQRQAASAPQYQEKKPYPPNVGQHQMSGAFGDRAQKASSVFTPTLSMQKQAQKRTARPGPQQSTLPQQRQQQRAPLTLQQQTQKNNFKALREGNLGGYKGMSSMVMGGGGQDAAAAPLSEKSKMPGDKGGMLSKLGGGQQPSVDPALAAQQSEQSQLPSNLAGTWSILGAGQDQTEAAQQNEKSNLPREGYSNPQQNSVNVPGGKLVEGGLTQMDQDASGASNQFLLPGQEVPNQNQISLRPNGMTLMGEDNEATQIPGLQSHVDQFSANYKKPFEAVAYGATGDRNRPWRSTKGTGQDAEEEEGGLTKTDLTAPELSDTGPTAEQQAEHDRLQAEREQGAQESKQRAEDILNEDLFDADALVKEAEEATLQDMMNAQHAIAGQAGAQGGGWGGVLGETQALSNAEFQSKLADKLNDIYGKAADVRLGQLDRAEAAYQEYLDTYGDILTAEDKWVIDNRMAEIEEERNAIDVWKTQKQIESTENVAEAQIQSAEDIAQSQIESTEGIAAADRESREKIADAINVLTRDQMNQDALEALISMGENDDAMAALVDQMLRDAGMDDLADEIADEYKKAGSSSMSDETGQFLSDSAVDWGLPSETIADAMNQLTRDGMSEAEAGEALRDIFESSDPWQAAKDAGVDMNFGDPLKWNSDELKSADKMGLTNDIEDAFQHAMAINLANGMDPDRAREAALREFRDLFNWLNAYENDSYSGDVGDFGDAAYEAQINFRWEDLAKKYGV